MIDKDLINKFYKGECTDAEVQKVLSWFDDQHTGEKYIKALWHSYEKREPSATHNSQQILKTIHQRTGITERRTQYLILHKEWAKIAAILIFAFSLSFLITENELNPDTLTSAIHYVTKENPAGRKSVIHLPDGTVVHLNAASNITYPEGFSDSIRSVALVGEAFFEVAEDKSKPFIVSVAGVDTRALGTSFNVKAYAEDQHVQVVLASGKVKVSQSGWNDDAEVFLSPGEEAWVQKKTRAMHKQEADLYTSLAWKDNLMVFNQASAKQVFTTLERWYGVDISFSEAMPADEWSFAGEFKGESLENVLLSISYVKSFEYQINDQSIVITP
ncbi:transmembrane sensor [Catalinimonas alkaloidigena]|uniref:FecR family protein n=1 Tax=Catalinimonas alkaloidigena TaxID=1075417 RepID=UPI0024066915|nr:FecR family protein [Catalinimonas alkaloidigena]MDF9799621.1 transmembrane sensor [Catalinimonas alkaloidigena]